MGDACRLPGVQQRIKHMLGLLPTDQSLLSTLRAALTSAQPARALATLLTGSGTPGSLPVQPTRLLYTLEVCYSSTPGRLSCTRNAGSQCKSSLLMKTCTSSMGLYIVSTSRLLS